MEKTVQSIPFLRLSIALSVGILFASYISIPLWFIIGLVVFLLVLELFLKLNYRFTTSSVYGIVLHLFLFSIGILLYQNFNQKPQLLANGNFLATILEAPQEKQNSYKSLLKIEGFYSNNSYFKSNEKVLVYFEKEKNAKELIPGERVAFSTTPQIIKNNGNPFEFDYKTYMESRKIYRQVYLSSGKWRPTTLPHSKSITIKAELARMKLLGIYAKQKLGEDESEILSALTLGYKRELDPEIKQVFSAAGAMHVLAVSGLHVGIVYGFLAFLLGFLNRKRAGKLVFTVISVLALWSFAFITGLSPSVMRASTMFSFIVLGKYSNRQTNIYNTLAASAFILLIINPNNLFDVGFQLSYSAVFGIVFLQPKLAALYTVKNKILNYFWALITVSVAAQIVTFPFAVYYFNQFPTYFWISNLFVIPAAIILIPLAITMLAFSSIPIISIFISGIINFVISSLYFGLKEIENLPYSVINISILKIEFLLILVLLFCILITIKTQKILHLKLALFVLFLLSITSTFSKIKVKNQNEIIVYNNPQNQVVQLISGKSNYIISEHEFQENSFEESQIRNTTVAMHLNSPIIINKNAFYQNENILLKNGIVFFEGKLILLNRSINKITQKFKPDFVINPPVNNEFDDISSEIQVVITERNIHKNNNKNTGIYLVVNQGAFRKKW